MVINVYTPCCWQVGFRGTKRIVVPPKAQSAFGAGNDAKVDEIMRKEFK